MGDCRFLREEVSGIRAGGSRDRSGEPTHRQDEGSKVFDGFPGDFELDGDASGRAVIDSRRDEHGCITAMG